MNINRANDFVRSHANKPISEDLTTYLSRYEFPLIGEPKEDVQTIFSS